jgi:ABC-type uncharacterized transport system involved in gliding motility auxiliary subunit
MKRLALSLKFLKPLVWGGPMLIVAGLSAGFVAGSWDWIPMSMIFLGLVFLGLGLIALSQAATATGSTPQFWDRRATEASVNGLVATLAVLAILAVINVLGVRYAARWDLTETRLFTLAPETQQILRNLPQAVKVWVFDSQQNAQDRELLESYRRRSDRFSFEFVNPNAQPGLAQTFDLKSPGEVFVAAATTQQKRLVQRVSEQERLSEPKLTDALARLISDRRTQAYLVQGHGERAIEEGRGSISQAIKLLEDKNVMTKPLILAESGEIPVDANVVIVAGAKQPLLEAEVKLVQDYLDRGGNALVMVDANTNPGLDKLLQAWGVTVDKRVAIDASRRVQGLGPADATVTQYGNHPITQDFGNSLSFYSLARPLDIKPIAGIQVVPLLYTSDRSWAETNLTARPLKLDATDSRGPLVLGAALSRSVKPTATPNATPTPSESRLVVIGNSSFATDGLLRQGVNSDVFVNAVRWLGQQDSAPLSISPKTTRDRRINLSAQDANLATWTALGLLPLLGFGSAAWIWWRQR